MLKARRHKDHGIVYVNICTSNSVPLCDAVSSKFSANVSESVPFPEQALEEGPIYMVGMLQVKKDANGGRDSESGLSFLHMSGQNEKLTTTAVDVFLHPLYLRAHADNGASAYLKVSLALYIKYCSGSE